MKTVIIGGVAGGASAAARLRRLDEKAEIVVLERGGFVSFANCGLPYYIGGEIKDRDDLELQTPESLHARFNIDIRIFSEVTKIDRADKSVTVKNHQTGETYNESYDSLILSPGSAPLKPPIDGVDSKRVFTVRTIPDADEIMRFIKTEKPQSAAVIGGGYIGVETAENLHRAGLEVTIIEMAEHLIAALDYEMAYDVHNYMHKKGIHLRLGRSVERISESDAGLTLTLANQSGEIKADMVILAAGVKPESELAQAAGLETTKRGAIIVNPGMQTSDRSIYAVGDAVAVREFVTGRESYIPLAGPANKQGRIAADNICDLGSTYNGTQGSAVIKVYDMTAAVTGITEETAKSLKLDYDKVYTFSPSHAGYYPGGREMSIKTIFEKETGKILGAQLVGYGGVSKRCDVFAAAIRAGMTAFDLTELELCYAPPFSSAKDPVNFAGYVIENTITGKVKNYHWNEVFTLKGRHDLILLDVRTPREYNAGHIEGAINIELDSLRENLNKLDKNKTIYVNCRSGQRSYIACRVLTQNGFECYNLSGGYRLYDSVINSKIAEESLCGEKS